MSRFQAPSDTKWKLSDDWLLSEETYDQIKEWIDLIASLGAPVVAGMLSEIPVVGPLLGWALVKGGAWLLKKLLDLIPRAGDDTATSFAKQEELYREVLKEEQRIAVNENKIKMNQKLIPNRANEILPPKVVMAKDLSSVLQPQKLMVRNNKWKMNRPILPIMIYPKNDIELKKMGLWMSSGFPMANPVGFVKSLDELYNPGDEEGDLSHWATSGAKSQWGLERRIWGDVTAV